MKSLQMALPAATSIENNYRNWETQRFLIDDDLPCGVDEEPAQERNARIWAIVYGVLGVLSCIFVLAQADRGQPGRFLVYLGCANLAVFGLRLTSIKCVLPAGFLFLLRIGGIAV